MKVFSSYGSVNRGQSSESEGLVGSSFIEAKDDGSAVESGGLIEQSQQSDDSETSPGGDASIGSEVANLTKNLLGTGVLSLSGGIAIFSNSKDAIWPAAIWTTLLGLMFGYYCDLIAKICEMTGTKSFSGCWDATIGRGSIAITLAQTILPAQANLACATVLSQIAKPLLEAVGIHLSRVTCLILVMVCFLLPLCLMDSIDALAPFSSVGVAGIGITMLAMVYRCADGSYQPGGKFFDNIEPDQRPEFGHETQAMSLLVLPFVCMVFQSWVMHYNSPRYYAELKDPTIPRFTATVGASFGLAGLFYISIAVAGFWTFGAHSDPCILNNYAANDPVASIGRVCVGFSTLLTYPLAFFGVRDGCLDAAGVPQETRTRGYLKAVTVGILTVTTIVAVFVSDLGLINAVGGGLFSTLLCIIYPSLMYYKAVQNSSTKTRRQRMEAIFALILMCVGTTLGLVGSVVSVFKRN